MGRWATAVFAFQALVIAQAANSLIPPSESSLLYERIPPCRISTVQGDTIFVERLSAQQPVVLTFVFARCVGACSPMLASLAAATEWLEESSSPASVIVASFDSSDTPSSLSWMADAYRDRRRWIIGTVVEPERRSLLRTLQFNYMLSTSGPTLFDHPSVVYVIGQGKVVRVILGYVLTQKALKAAIEQARGELIPAYPLPDPRIPFRCVEYDPQSQTVEYGWGIVVLGSPLVIGSLICFIVVLLSSMHSSTHSETSYVRRPPDLSNPHACSGESQS
ncbi:MAG: SCO family protein [Bacteroidota bacterium]|nr:SCO family protein [Candidatus Kapabacteria bacterium]MDW8075072.1 SCO family protein [Bacteroidota bacterium]